MMPWFLWKNVDSRTMDVWVSQLPPPTRAAERVQEVTIPGRAGTLTLKEGENVHECYVKECVITAPWTADFSALLDWLTGDGQVIFSSEPDRVYWAHLAGEVRFDRISNSLKQCRIPFYVHPHKGQYPPESDITLPTVENNTPVNASGTLSNPGNVASKPIFTLTFASACKLSVNGSVMTFVHNNSEALETITVDCDAQLVTDSNGIWSGKVYGEFPTLEPGENSVEYTYIFPAWASGTSYYENDIITFVQQTGEKMYRAPKDSPTLEEWEYIALVSESPSGSITIKPRWRWC